MKKKNILLSFLAVWAIALSACLFDSDEDGLSNWLSDQGLPDSYKVQTVSIDGLVPSKVVVSRDSTPLIMDSRVVLGNAGNMSHEVAFEFLYKEKKDGFLKRFRSADTIGAYISLNLLTSFYNESSIPVELLPIKEDLNVNVSWSLRSGKNEDFLDSLYYVTDSAWVKMLQSWKPDVIVDTTYSIKIKKSDVQTKKKKNGKTQEPDSRVLFELPGAFLDSFKTCKKYCYLEMRLSAPETENLYRFYSMDSKHQASLNLRAKSEGDSLYDLLMYTPYRMANVVVSNDCSDCLVLHGGVKDSMVFEYSAEPVLKALSDFYGDGFPYEVGDGNDVRQAVVLAQLTFARDDSDSKNYLGLPIWVVASSFIDSSGKERRIQESYKPNRPDIAENGHRNMVFYDGDSLTLQVTQGLRDFINRASNGAKLKFMINLSFPQLQDNDSTYRTHIIQKDTVKTRVVYGDTVEMKLSKGDTSYVYLGYYDYARYDFSSMMQKPATLKLWLATKRGGDDE